MLTRARSVLNKILLPFTIPVNEEYGSTSGVLNKIVNQFATKTGLNEKEQKPLLYIGETLLVRPRQIEPYVDGLTTLF